jgi:hypothetical protein
MASLEKMVDVWLQTVEGSQEEAQSELEQMYRQHQEPCPDCIRKDAVLGQCDAVIKGLSTTLNESFKSIKRWAGYLQSIDDFERRDEMQGLMTRMYKEYQAGLQLLADIEKEVA